MLGRQRISERDVLSSRSCTYQVQSFLGKGAYGEVLQCVNQDTNETVAIKIFQLSDRRESEREVDHFTFVDVSP